MSGIATNSAMRIATVNHTW